MTLNSKPSGLILMGGKSSRMGQNKAELMIHSRPLWQNLRDSLAGVTDDIFLSLSSHVKEPEKFSHEKIVHDIFLEPFGPLGGILSAFKKYPERAFFVVACDLPFFGPEAAAYLLSERDENYFGTVFVDDEGRFEPLMGIYEPTIASYLAKAWILGVHCPRKILGELEIKKVKCPDGRWRLNLNHRHEYEALFNQKTITVRFFAGLKEQTQKNEEVVATNAITVGELVHELASRYGFLEAAISLQAARNHALAAMDDVLLNNDEVALLPPMSGG